MVASPAAIGNIDEIAHLDPGSLMTVRGWAALAEDPGGATGVFAIVDDGPPIEMVRGIERRDVAAALGDERFVMAGFRGILSISRLSFGSHRLRVAIRTAEGTLVDAATPMSFAVVETLEQRLIAAPSATVFTRMAIDEIKIDQRTGTIPIVASQDDVVYLRGWAIDEPEHALAHSVYAVIGSNVIRAEYGGARADVAAYHRDERLRDCGFSLEIPLDTLLPGHYSIRVRVVGAGEHVIYEGYRIALEVGPFAASGAASPGGVPTRGVVDKMAVFDARGNIIDPPAPLTLAKGNQLFLSGWAIDEPNDCLARAVHVSVDGLVSKPAVYGLERRDVARHFHRPDLTECGFTALVATASMPLGPHYAIVRVIDRAGTRFYDLEQRVDFTVIEASSGP